MEIQEQKMEVALPTLLMDARGSSVQAVQPGLETWGYLAVEGTLEYGLSLGCRDDDPSRVTVNLRLLTARYSPPAGASQQVLETVNQLNCRLAERLLGGDSPGAELP